MSDSNETRMTLIQRVSAKNRDEYCWEEFLSTYRNYIYAIIRKFNLNKELCDDLFQDILVGLWKDLPKFEYRPQSCRFRTWLSVVCRNVVLTYLKSKAGRKRSLEVNYDEICDTLNKFSEAEIENIAEKDWKLFIAEKAMANISESLSEKLLDIFNAAMDGKTDEELGQKYKTSEASIRVYRHRVKNALMKEIIRLNKDLDS
ncbi:MAG: sigma-70 family RNA polymerase sigma factor [Lentisphaeraceae bacterium]|nr:sigma-70 family RNA polymerase sigma factor [Lentisphaeraceae bacterium]